MTLRKFFRERYRPVRLATAAAGTIEQYEIALNQLQRYAGHDPTLGELDAELVAGCLAALVSRGRSPATANKIRAHLLAVWRYAVRRGLIDRPPDVDRRSRIGWRAAASRSKERAPARRAEPGVTTATCAA